MSEMIIPGTYIHVRAEGLISAGGVATGIVGVVGTSARGPLNQMITLAGFSQARELLGPPDNYASPEEPKKPLTLVRALEQVYKNGASVVVGVRVAGKDNASATYTLLDAKGGTAAELTAKTPGTWGNQIQIRVDPATDGCRVNDEIHADDFTKLAYPVLSASSENRIRVYRGATKSTMELKTVYKSVYHNDQATRQTEPLSFQVKHWPVQNVPAITRVQVLNQDGQVVTDYSGSAILYDSNAILSADQVNLATQTGVLTFGTNPLDNQTVQVTYAAGSNPPSNGEVLIAPWDGGLSFAAGEAPDKKFGDKLLASYVVDPGKCVVVTLISETTKETYTVPDGRLLVQRITSQSTLVNGAKGSGCPASGLVAHFDGGNNGAAAGRAEYAAGLDILANQLVNIVVLAGQDAGQMGDLLDAHLKQTEATDFERIGVIGAPGSDTASYLGHHVASDRIVLVAPGIASPDGLKLPAAYTAAAVAGLIASLPVQASLTNKVLTIPQLDYSFNRGEQIQLIQKNILAVVDKNGYRVLKGVLTGGAPFAAIPTRRIVDYARQGVRQASNPYIGRLNNIRVRAALQATLEGFLTRMVEDEALTGFDLEVSATRDQEINGEVSVVMTLRPTFSIDYIRVVMNLK